MAASSSSPMEDQQRLDEQQQLQLQPVIHEEKECVYKTKLIQFLGRSTPIILQNENGPCPLLAICNVLLLRNILSLNPETTEVSQEKLLSLVAERLIDSNSDIDNKDAGYIENQQQNIADAIDLLPRLATGIDVNLKFRRIDDFEFTRECAIFDLLDIPLYHGWIVDHQDYDTADSIGSKSYNSLMGELVALETQCLDKAKENSTEVEDFVDFAAATTATLGVPSPCLSKSMSFDNPTHAITDYHVLSKGEREEETELLRALELSIADIPNTADVSLSTVDGRDDTLVALDKTACSKDIETDLVKVPILEEHSNLGSSSSNPEKLEVDSSDIRNHTVNLPSAITLQQEPPSSVTDKPPSSVTDTDLPDYFDQLKHLEPRQTVIENMVDEKNISMSAPAEGVPPDASAEHNGHMDENTSGPLGHGEKSVNVVDTADIQNADEIPASSIPSGPSLDCKSSSSAVLQTDLPEAFTPKIDDSEPIYEGEECILDPSTPRFADREPVYEGEVVLAEQADKGTADAQEMTSKMQITKHQGELIRTFLRNNASQLTIYGLFCLQDGLKERELCVFFRNNHFSTMFKFEGELYLLATDQGYINQPDLVWEKLNEVNGDSLFMTGNFKEFRIDSQSNNNSSWDEHNAVANTADYIASMDSASQAGFDMNSDLQLAIALQQQEFDQQQQQQRQTPQQTQVDGSRLVTGPQVPRSRARYPPSSSRPEEKKSDKCSIM